jgi:hypothetical protein
MSGLLRSLYFMALAAASLNCAISAIKADGIEQPLWLVASGVFIVAAELSDRRSN